MPGWRWPSLLVHRCGGALAPENTLAGLRIAARLGCRAVEFDVMLSRDKLPVLIHDETLARTAGVAVAVPQLDAEHLLATDVGRCFHPAFTGETIPSLSAALKACAELGLAANVEIKPAAGVEAETGSVVGELLRARRVADSPEILLSSFSIEALAAAAAHVPELPRALLVESHTPQNLALALQLGCVSLNVGCNGLEAKHVSDTLSAGLRVMAYTVNTCEAAAQLTDWGVCGLFTDRPDLLHARQT
ncbi:glycerophosphodiester phosphodiesterase [Zoogloea sp.]|uniref:glycerophosphodiester phosphodiesterase n=1 Tax=Zoogloea sp. TaxID=49181 RepID=UPI0035AF6F93